MASTRKSTKRTAGTKRRGAKRAPKKRSARKAPSKRRAEPGSPRPTKTTRLKRKAKKGLRAAREGLDRVRQVGEKTWEALKSTTGQVIDDVRDRLGEDSRRE
jgi:hypothetical protein